jgi:hypothetical protein
MGRVFRAFVLLGLLWCVLTCGNASPELGVCQAACSNTYHGTSFGVSARTLRSFLRLVTAAALVVAMFALLVAAWCEAKNREPQARSDLLSAHPQSSQPTVPSLPATNVEQRLSKLEAVTPDMG